MALVYLSLGSNLGDRDKYLKEARLAIEKSFSSVRFSKVYETEPVDFKQQPWFLNQVAEVQTELAPDSLLEWVHALECRHGRLREIPNGPRTLDVDILLYDDWVLDESNLTVPHPRMTERRHVLVPLSELAPELRIPAGDLLVSETLEQLKDLSQVKPHAAS